MAAKTTKTGTNKKEQRERKELLSVAPAFKNPFLLSPEEKLRKNDNKFLKRISPFLLLTFTLLVLFPLMMIYHTGKIQSEWVLLFLFPFIIANLLLFDFALWNYFKGKKIARIWIIETCVSILIMHFLI